MTAATLTDQDYILYNTPLNYTHDEYVVDPSYCPVTYTYAPPTQFTDDSGTSDSITTPDTPGQNDFTFSIYWDTNGSPLG